MCIRDRYKESGISVNKCKGGKNYAEFEFLNGITLEEKLDTLLKEGKTDQAEELLFTYTDMVKKIHEREEFYKTEDFVRVFGNVRLKPGLKCAAISNIDLVPANIILEQGRASVIDYEWTFSFPVPSQFIVYRMIHYYLESDGKREVLRQRNFYEKAGLTEEDCKVFAEMERNFQQYMLGSHASMLSLYRRISPGKADAVILDVYKRQAYLFAQLEEREKIYNKRMEIYEYYHRNLAHLAAEGKIEQPFVPEECIHNAHMYYIKVHDMEVRTRLIRYLREKGICSVFHYVPLHSAPAGVKYGRLDVYKRQEWI